MLNVSKDELRSRSGERREFDQALFKKVYEEEYGTFGGAPYSALLGDFAFGRHPKDVILLEKLSNVAAPPRPDDHRAAPDLFDLTDYRDLDKPRDLTKIFESAELIKWRSFRDSEDSRYVTLVLPADAHALRAGHGPGGGVRLRRGGQRHRSGPPGRAAVGNAQPGPWGAHHGGLRPLQLDGRHPGLRRGGMVPGSPLHLPQTTATWR